MKTVSPVRQKFALLISKGNFVDSESTRFQQLSTLIGRFFASQPTRPPLLSPGQNIVSSLLGSPLFTISHLLMSLVCAVRHVVQNPPHVAPLRRGHF
jgi:hypothetical protein